eukprot:CAMPEP_0196657968 /NCGR_PEP_ID=MMETSP1086-20130531/26428_1 /TAXON_ID=77921 /ORGANISM="Cyanoptyche  gloeocystis , Strain SAG4.97" /LENGTH=227 /DNA_ID=CAMNT_0041991297 /DNA_START=248 /DNA_END=932 /DNA_ORIENTATION=-
MKKLASVRSVARQQGEWNAACHQSGERSAEEVADEPHEGVGEEAGELGDGESENGEAKPGQEGAEAPADPKGTCGEWDRAYPLLLLLVVESEAAEGAQGHVGGDTLGGEEGEDGEATEDEAGVDHVPAFWLVVEHFVPSVGFFDIFPLRKLLREADCDAWSSLRSEAKTCKINFGLSLHALFQLHTENLILSRFDFTHPVVVSCSLFFKKFCSVLNFFIISRLAYTK